jgi:hypothetical protein
MPGAGRTRKPRGLKRKVPTSQYRYADTTGIPCAMALRLTPRSPRGTGLDSPRRLPVGRLDPSVGQGYRIWVIACKRKASSQPARLILRRIEA